jgi:antitoxin HicB
MARRSPIGSDFDAFLQEQGLLEESAAVALKRVVAWQLAEAMKAQGVTKADMAMRMHTSRSQLDRVLGAQGGGMTLETLGRAIDALGLQIRLEVQDGAAGNATTRRAAAPRPRRAAATSTRKPKTTKVARKRA